MLTKRRAECMASEFYDNRMYDDFVFCEQTEEIFFYDFEPLLSIVVP